MTLHKKTKIIATIGPASEKEDVLEKLVQQGLDAARLNFSHGSHQEHGARIKLVRKLEKKYGRHIAVIADIQGPKLRVGNLPEHGVELKNGEIICFDTGKKDYENGVIPMPSEILGNGTKEGHVVFLDDGTIQLKVQKRRGTLFEAEVLKGGILLPKKGINVPLLEIASSILNAKDRADIKFASESGADYIAISFLRNANDVKAARRLLKGSDIKVIAKIERPEALINLDEIADEADAVMVARGDLGIETPLWELPIRQKEIVEQVRKRMKPVIVATQMLDSMIRNPLPTRAEVSDVANAVLDSADAVMLSGETASGKYPVEAVEMMHKILLATEHNNDYAHELQRDLPYPTIMSIAHSATYIASEVKAKAIIASTLTGLSAKAVSYFRPSATLYGATDNERTAREMSIVWGVEAMVVKSHEAKNTEELLNLAMRSLRRAAKLDSGDKAVCLFGEKLGVAGGTNMVTVKSVL